MSTSQPPTTPYAFVSYASADRERVEPVVAALERAGVAVWLDRQGIAGGESYALAIAEAIEGCAALVLLTSAASLASRNVRQELALAWRYERPYVPLLLEPVTTPREVAYWLEASQWVEVLDRPEAAWLPAVLTALAPLGIIPAMSAPIASPERLAGREREQVLLRERLDAALAGRGGLVLVGGEAGVGKTTLVEATLAEAAPQGALTLTGRCYDLAETPPYGPWIELFGRYRSGPGDPPHPPVFAVRDTVGAVPSQAALVAEVRDWLVALTTLRPVMLLLEDLHWADPATLDLLRAVARDLADLPVLILATYRDDELTRRHPLYTLLPVLERESRAARLDLRRLDGGGVRDLVAQRYSLPDADAARLVAWLHSRAEGNAFFTTQLLRALEDEGALRQGDDGWALGDLAAVGLPAPLRQVLDARLDQLGEEHLRLLALAAVIGQEVPLALWAAVAETDEDGLLDTIERAVESHVLVESLDGVGVRFAHALIREAVYTGMLVLRRRRIHRRVGETLVAGQHPDPDAVAYHLQQAGDARAAEWLLHAGDRAWRSSAWLTAAARVEAAVTLLEARGAPIADRGWLLMGLARMRRFTDPQASLIHLADALRLVAGAGEPALYALLLYDQGMAHMDAGDLRRGIRDMEAGLAALDALTPAERDRVADVVEAASETLDSRVARCGLAITLARAGRYDEARALAEAMARETLDKPDRRELHGSADGNARHALGMARAALGQPQAAHRAYAEALACYRAANHHVTLGSAACDLLVQVVLPYMTEHLAERRALVSEAEEAWALSDLPPRNAALPLLLLEGAWAAVDGQDAAAVSLIDAATRGWLARERGETSLALELVARHLPGGPATEPGGVVFLSTLALHRLGAALAVDAGDLTAGHRWLDAHDRWLDWNGTVLGRAEGQLGWSAHQRASGDLALARAHADRALAYATEPRQPLALLAAHRLLGELDTAEGCHAEAATHLAASLALAEACAAPYERALCLLALTELHLATGDRPSATTTLAEARAILEPLEARPALARADALAGRLEATP